jgi:hypothetical protein
MESMVIIIRQCSARPIASAHLFRQLEGLALARAWGFESLLPHPFDSASPFAPASLMLSLWLWQS